MYIIDIMNQISQRLPEVMDWEIQRVNIDKYGNLVFDVTKPDGTMHEYGILITDDSNYKRHKNHEIGKNDHISLGRTTLKYGELICNLCGKYEMPSGQMCPDGISYLP